MNLEIVKYDLKRFLNDKIFMFYSLLMLFLSAKILIDFKYVHTGKHFSFMDGIIYCLSNAKLLSWIIIPASLYYMTNIFFDYEINDYLKIRSRTKLNWFTQKLVSLLTFNCIIIALQFVTAVTVSIFIFDLEFNWGGKNEGIFQFQSFYSPSKALLFIIFFLIFGITLLGLFAAFFSLLLNKPKFGMVFGFVYFTCSSQYVIIASKRFEFLKYFTIDSFINFNNHNFDGMTSWFYTVKQSFFITVGLAIALYIICVFTIKKIEVFFGD